MSKRICSPGGCLPHARSYVPDLGFPKGQLVFIAKVQGHVLSIVHQRLGDTKGRWRALRIPTPTRSAGGAPPPRLQSEASCAFGVRPSPGRARASFLLPSPPLPPGRPRSLLPSSPPSSSPQHPCGPTCFILPGAHLKTPAEGPGPRRVRGAGPRRRPAEQVPGGGGARGAQSAVAGWGAGLGRAGAGLGSLGTPGGRRETADAQSGGMQGEDRARPGGDD